MNFKNKRRLILLCFIFLAGSLTVFSLINLWQEEKNSYFHPPILPKNSQEGIITVGEIIMSTTEGYNWWSYVPMTLGKSDNAYILLEMSHAQSEDYLTLTNDARQNVVNWISYAELRKYIIVTAAVPRNFSAGYYPQGINVHSLNSSTPEFYYRPDLKVNSIISELKNNLTDAGYTPAEKILVAGFSAGGMWANRYTLLHPEKVLAAAMGQAGGWLAMPLSEYNGSLLNWPMGLHNFHNLTGNYYNKTEILKEVPQFIYIGDLDTSSTYCNEGYPYCDNITIWGTTDPERIENQYNYLEEHDYKVQFKLYEGYGHTYNYIIKNDVMDFFDSIIRSGEDGTIPGFELFIILPIILLSVIILDYIRQKNNSYSLMTGGGR